MAFIDKIDRNRSQPLWVPVSSPADQHVGFTPLQWSIILDAPRDPLTSLRSPGRMRRLIRWFTGGSTNLNLGNPHLEALRRTALLTWHYGLKLPADEMSEFLAAGFSMKQFDLMVSALRTVVGTKRKFAR